MAAVNYACSWQHLYMTSGIIVHTVHCLFLTLQYQRVKWHFWRFGKASVRNFADLLYSILFYSFLFCSFIYYFVLFINYLLCLWRQCLKYVLFEVVVWNYKNLCCCSSNRINYLTSFWITNQTQQLSKFILL